MAFCTVSQGAICLKCSEYQGRQYKWLIVLRNLPLKDVHARISPWKEQLLWPSARMRQMENVKWTLTHSQNKQGKSDWLNLIINEILFPCLLDLVEISIGNYTSASFWQRVAPTAPLYIWDKRTLFLTIQDMVVNNNIVLNIPCLVMLYPILTSPWGSITIN